MKHLKQLQATIHTKMKPEQRIVDTHSVCA